MKIVAHCQFCSSILHSIHIHVTGPEDANDKNFDFESNLAEFTKNTTLEDEDVNESNEEDNVGTYDKNDFFDSISCDVLDRQAGVDNRLRGKEERTLNTETFGATSLGFGGRRGNRRYRSGGGERGGGRGGRGGRGRGRRFDRDGDGRPRENNRWREGSQSSGRGGGRGNRRTYGDGRPGRPRLAALRVGRAHALPARRDPARRLRVRHAAAR